MEIKEGLGFTELIVDTVEEFIELIRPDKKNFKEYLKSVNDRYIYRGQADSNWKLIPSLYRNINRNKILSDTYDVVCFKHWAHLQDFIYACDLNSSAIPFDSFEFRKFVGAFDNRMVRDSWLWPDSKLYELLAYAQHYGVNTELLDWTKNPLIACYFAASQVVKMKKIEGHISIWIFDREKEDSLSNHDEKLFEIIEVPKSINQNISTQQGCFTLVRQEIIRGTKLTFNENMDKYEEIKNLNELIAEKKIDALIKISVPCRCAIDILEYCDAYSVNTATLFRGISGAAMYVQEGLEMKKYEILLEIQKEI